MRELEHANDIIDKPYKYVMQNELLYLKSNIQDP